MAIRRVSIANKNEVGSSNKRGLFLNSGGFSYTVKSSEQHSDCVSDSSWEHGERDEEEAGVGAHVVADVREPGRHGVEVSVRHELWIRVPEILHHVQVHRPI